jgi:hypothetical protein
MSVSPRFLETIFLLNFSSYPYDVASIQCNAKACLRCQQFYNGGSYMQVTTIPRCPLMRLDRKNSYVNALQYYVMRTLPIFLFLTRVLRPVAIATT